jgi:hypothetical protein
MVFGFFFADYADVSFLADLAVALDPILVYDQSQNFILILVE